MSKSKLSANTVKNTLVKFTRLAVCLCIFFALCSKPAFSKAYHATLQEMIERCDGIAIANIGPVKQIKEKGPYFNFSKEAQVSLIESLKGKLPNTFVLRGGEDFVCAQVHFSEGKNILFLKKENDLFKGDYFTGANWDSSCLAVKNDSVRWFNNQDERHTSTQVSLEVAKKEIKDIMSGKMVSMKLPPYLDTMLKATQFADHIKGESPACMIEWTSYTQARSNSAGIKKELQYIAARGSSAGKLYAACALMATDKKAGLELLKKLKESKDQVLYRSGCRGSNVAVNEIATSLIDNGKFLNFSINN